MGGTDERARLEQAWHDPSGDVRRGVSADHVHGFGRVILQNDGRANTAENSLTPVGR